MNDAYLYTEDLSVGYKNNPLIKNICLSMKRGEILALIGPNGAGKSTILKSIIRQLPLIGGKVILNGTDMATYSSSALAREMACVQTNRFATELLTIEDVVSAGRYPYTGAFGLLSAEDHRIIRESMELVRIADMADRDFTEISDGQRQRVLLARALCQEPELLILDEPTSFLDIRYKLEFLSMLRSLTRNRNMSVILSIHELELAQRIADKVVCVKGDTILRFGTPEEVFEPGFVEQMFEIQNGSFYALSGSAELEPAVGSPSVFVLGGCGFGTPVYRKLQRRGMPFKTGILWENDIDFPTASALSAGVISLPAFESIADSHLQAAKNAMDRTGTVIQALPTEKMSGLAAPLKELVQYAEQKNYLTIL